MTGDGGTAGRDWARSAAIIEEEEARYGCHVDGGGIWKVALRLPCLLAGMAD